MSVINALASTYQDPNEQLMRSAQYASNAWENFMSGMIIKRAGDEILDLFVENKGRVKPESLANIAKKYHMPLNLFGTTIDLLRKSGALDVERAKWGEPFKGTGRYIPKGAFGQRSPEGEYKVIAQAPKPSGYDLFYKRDTGEAAYFPKGSKIPPGYVGEDIYKAGMKTKEPMVVIKGEKIPRKQALEDLKQLGKILSEDEKANVWLMSTGKENFSLDKLDSKGKKTLLNTIAEIAEDEDTSSIVRSAAQRYLEIANALGYTAEAEPTTSPVTHIWKNGRLVPVGE